MESDIGTGKLSKKPQIPHQISIQFENPINSLFSPEHSAIEELGGVRTMISNTSIIIYNASLIFHSMPKMNEVTNMRKRFGMV